MSEFLKNAFIICGGYVISRAADGHWDVEDEEDTYPFETLDEAVAFAAKPF